MKQQNLSTKYGKMFHHGGLINLLKKHEKISVLNIQKS